MYEINYKDEKSEYIQHKAILLLLLHIQSKYDISSVKRAFIPDAYIMKYITKLIGPNRNNLALYDAAATDPVSLFLSQYASWDYCSTHSLCGAPHRNFSRWS